MGKLNMFPTSEPSVIENKSIESEVLPFIADYIEDAVVEHIEEPEKEYKEEVFFAKVIEKQECSSCKDFSSDFAQIRAYVQELEEQIQSIPQQTIIEKQIIEQPIQVVKENRLECSCPAFNDSEMKSLIGQQDIKIESVKDDIKVLKVIHSDFRNEFKRDMNIRSIGYAILGGFVVYLLTVLF